MIIQFWEAGKLKPSLLLDSSVEVKQTTSRVFETEGPGISGLKRIPREFCDFLTPQLAANIAPAFTSVTFPEVHG